MCNEDDNRGILGTEVRNIVLGVHGNRRDDITNALLLDPVCVYINMADIGTLSSGVSP